MSHSRAKISLITQNEMLDFISRIGVEKDRFSVENFDGTQRVCACSILGMLYASGDFGDSMYVVNDTRDGVFPSVVDDYRE